MRFVRLLTFLVAVACCLRSASGHGFGLSLSGKALQATSEESNITGNPLLFLYEIQVDGDTRTAVEGGPGATNFGNDKQLAFDIQSRLYYSNGGAAGPAPAGISLSIEDQLFVRPTRTVTGTSGPLPIAGFAIGGNETHELFFTLSDTVFTLPADPPNIPAGVYGFAYTVRGNPTASPGSPYVPTPWLTVMWYTEDFAIGSVSDPNSPYNRASNAVFAAVNVPEPSSAVSVVLGGAALVMIGWNRRKRLLE